MQTYHPLCWRIRRLRFLSASRLAQIRQASEQYAWLVVGRYSFPHTGHFFWRWEVSFPVRTASSAGSTGSTDRSKYRSTIYEAYSKSSPGEGRAFPARHSWRISLLPAFGSLHARSGSAPAAGRSFLPSPLLRKFQLEIHILFACIIQHHHSVIGFAGFLTEKPGHGNAALL